MVKRFQKSQYTMKKLISVFDDVFYLSYLFFQRHPKLFAKSEAINALIVLECIIIIPLSCIIGDWARHANLPSIRDTFDLRMIVLILGGGLCYILYRHYIQNTTISQNEYALFRGRWEHMSQKQRQRRSLLIKSLIIVNIVGIPILTIILGHFNII